MNGYTLVESGALHALLLEVHDLRARQGVDGEWMDGMPPRLYAECVQAFEGVSEPLLDAFWPDNGSVADMRRSRPSFRQKSERRPLDNLDQGGCPMGTFSHDDPPVCTGSTPTTFAERRAIALSLLNHREPSSMLCTLVIAAMHGASLMTLAQIEAGRQAVNA